MFFLRHKHHHHHQRINTWTHDCDIINLLSGLKAKRCLFLTAKNNNKVNSYPSCFSTQQIGVKQVSCVVQKISMSQNSNAHPRKKNVNLLNLSLEKAIKANYD